jgi:alpha/beta superfamily hydrolase
MKKNLLALAVGVMITATAFAQRYANPVFTDVSVRSNIVYDSNRSVNLLFGQVPNQDPIITTNLLADIYTPAGDSACNRPVIILLHTGSYLPAIVNRQPTGNKNDSTIVEMATRFAKHGYVVIAMNYRLGWNAASTVQEDATEQLLKATYRAIQDVRNCVRYVRKNATGLGIDTSKIIVGGQGTGGYVALALATVNNRAEIETNLKFLRGDASPMVNMDTLGDWNGIGGIPFFNLPKDASVSGNVHMVFNYGGAMGDSTWLDAASIPMVGMHCVRDPFAPYRTGNVIVPTTGITVIPNASGAGAYIPYANTFGINNKINNATYNDPISVRARAINGGINNLYPFETVALEGSPWEWWDRTIMQGISFPGGNGRAADSLAMLTNPDMSATKAKAYIDTIVGFINPRIVVQFDLDAPGATDSIVVGRLNAPANNASVIVYDDSTRSVTITWSEACNPFPSTGTPEYVWSLTTATGNFDNPIIDVPVGTSTNLTLTEKAVWDLLGANGVAVGANINLKWTVFAETDAATRQYATWNINITRGTNVGLNKAATQMSMNVYPNPAKGIITVSAENMRNIEIVDITGRTVYTDSVRSNRETIALQGLQAGIYFVKVTAEDGKAGVKRIVVE